MLAVVKPDASPLQLFDASGLEPSAGTGETRRVCGWCGGTLDEDLRSDAVYCSQRCRQAAWRFRRPVRGAAHVSADPLRLAYADPPYPGLAAAYYADHPDFDGEVDHGELIARLCDEYPDGWALSTSAVALRDVWALCPPDTRVGAWFRGERPTRSYRPLAGWEPVLYRGGRAYIAPIESRRVDALVHVSRPRTTDPGRVIGAKPSAFAFWVFELLGALPGDTLDDLFPGSGGIARAWEVYSSTRAQADGPAAAQPDASGGDPQTTGRP